MDSEALVPGVGQDLQGYLSLSPSVPLDGQVQPDAASPGLLQSQKGLQSPSPNIEQGLTFSAAGRKRVWWVPVREMASLLIASRFSLRATMDSFVK
jgi:hypothetical protein